MKQISEAFGRRLKESGLTRIQWIALYYVNERQLITQTDLSENMYISVSSCARLIDRLERDGWVMRIPDPTDRRVHHLRLTETGKVLLDETIPIADQFNAELVKDISDEELALFERVMSRMVDNVC